MLRGAERDLANKGCLEGVYVRYAVGGVFGRRRDMGKTMAAGNTRPLITLLLESLTNYLSGMLWSH